MQKKMYFRSIDTLKIFSIGKCKFKSLFWAPKFFFSSQQSPKIANQPSFLVTIWEAVVETGFLFIAFDTFTCTHIKLLYFLICFIHMDWFIFDKYLYVFQADFKIKIIEFANFIQQRRSLICLLPS